MDRPARTLPPAASAPTWWCGTAEPVDRHLLALLRRAVVLHLDERRRVHPSVLHAGVPGAGTRTLPLDDEPLDHALRTDVVEAMVRRVRAEGPGPSPVLVWLTRSGSGETRDVDLLWSAAARAAAAELGHPLPMVVVTRRRWHDPATGTHRDWVRLRAERRAGA